MVLSVLTLKYEYGWLSHDAALLDYLDERRYDYILDFWRRGGQEGKEWGLLQQCFEGDRNELHKISLKTIAKTQSTNW